MAFNIVLVEPEIPQNTGNIVRTCGNGLQSAFDKTYRFRYKRQGVEKSGARLLASDGFHRV